VTIYITFIGCLIRAPNDVEVLAHNENLKNMLNSDEAVSNLLYSLDKENVIAKNSFLSGICEDLKSHCTKRRHKWKATLKQVYFKNPWTDISVFAASFSLYSLSYKRYALSFNCDRYLIPLYFFFFL
jgi:aromatic ring-opening dioxygenase LigB subunit